MPDFLQRDQAPLRGDQWTALDQAVVQTARAILVGRRSITLIGPFGPGVEALPSDSLAGTAAGQIDLLGNAEGEAVGIEQRRYLPLPLIYKDFWVHWRELEANRQLGLPLDTGKAAAAAARRGRRLRPLIHVSAEGVSSAPATLAPDDPLFAVDGFSMALEIETDVAGTLVVSLHDPHVEQTAFALLSDLVDVARGASTMRR
jgi:hypothetical protein